MNYRTTEYEKLTWEGVLDSIGLRMPRRVDCVWEEDLNLPWRVRRSKLPSYYILMLGGFWVGGWCTLFSIRTLMEFKAWQNCFVLMYLFLDSDSFYNCIASCHISLVNVTTNYCSNIFILVVKQIKSSNFITLKCTVGWPG